MLWNGERESMDLKAAAQDLFNKPAWQSSIEVNLQWFAAVLPNPEVRLLQDQAPYIVGRPGMDPTSDEIIWSLCGLWD